MGVDVYHFIRCRKCGKAFEYGEESSSFEIYDCDDDKLGEWLWFHANRCFADAVTEPPNSPFEMASMGREGKTFQFDNTADSWRRGVK